MAATVGLEKVDLKKYAIAPECDVCAAHPATNVGQGCADAHPVLLCDQCLEEGLEAICEYIRLWQREHRKVFICGDCYRPMLNLETHLDLRRLAH